MQNMRFNRLYPLSALISAILLILFCSRTDVIIGAGGGVVTDFNPGLTDLDRGFMTITLLDTAAGAALSLPASPDPLFGTFIADNMLVGLSDDGDTLAAHVQFSVAGDTSYAAEDSLVGAYICFRAADGEEAPGAINLFLSDTLRGFTPVNRAVMNEADNSLGSFSPGAGEDAGLLELSGDLADSLFRTRKSGDTAAFAFSIVDYVGPLIKLAKPYLVVDRMRKDCCSDSSWILPDTIRGAVARYSAFEDPEAAAVRAKEPYSSHLTQRTAVFKVDAGKIAGKLRDSLSRLGLYDVDCELLNAVITVRYHAPDTSGPPAGGVRLLTRNAGNFKALALDTLLTKDIDTLSDSAAHLLRYRFAKEGLTTDVKKPYTPLSFKTALRDAIRRHDRGEAAYVYVYLRAATPERSTIWWCKPYPNPPGNPSVTIETVFTPHGLHRGNDINK